MSLAKTIVIAGGTGFVGRQLTNTFTKQGHKVLVLSRKKQCKHTHFWDPLNPDTFMSTLENCDILINLCGASIAGGLWTKSRKKLLTESRMIPTKALVNAIASMHRPPEILFQASAIGIYPSYSDLNQSDKSIENSPLDRDFLATLCRDWEAVTAPIMSQTRVIHLRFGIILGQDGGMFKQLYPLFKYFLGHGLGKGKQPFSWIHINDIAHILSFLISQKKINGAVNIVSPNSCCFDDFSRMLASTLKRPYWGAVPNFVISKFLGEFSELFLNGQNVYPQRLIDHKYCFQYDTIDKAITHLCGLK